MDKKKLAAVFAAVDEYQRLEAASHAAVIPTGNSCSPWGLFGRIGLMRSRDSMAGRGRRGSAGGASSFEAAALRQPR